MSPTFPIFDGYECHNGEAPALVTISFRVAEKGTSELFGKAEATKMTTNVIKYIDFEVETNKNSVGHRIVGGTITEELRWKAVVSCHSNRQYTFWNLCGKFIFNSRDQRYCSLPLSIENELRWPETR